MKRCKEYFTWTMVAASISVKGKRALPGRNPWSCAECCVATKMKNLKPLGKKPSHYCFWREITHYTLACTCVLTLSHFLNIFQRCKYKKIMQIRRCHGYLQSVALSLVTRTASDKNPRTHPKASCWRHVSGSTSQLTLCNNQRLHTHQKAWPNSKSFL